MERSFPNSKAEDIEESLLDAFEKACRLWPDGSIPEYFPFWLFRTAYNHLLNQIKHSKSIVPLNPLDESIAGDHAVHASLIDVTLDFETVLKGIPPCLSQTLRLWVEGYSRRHIAEVLDTTEEAVHKRLQRVKALVMKIYPPHDFATTENDADSGYLKNFLKPMSNFASFNCFYGRKEALLLPDLESASPFL